MPNLHLLIAASIALWGAPLLAETRTEPTPRQSANGEFLFDHYPPRALAAREQGRVGFRVTLAKDGSLTSCDVTKSSGYASLDNETCELIVRYARFNTVRDAEGRAVRATQDGFVNWKHPSGMAANAVIPAVSQTASADPEKIICKRQVRTGSLVARTRQCMTRREWTRAAQQIQEEYGPIQGKGWSQERIPGGG